MLCEDRRLLLQKYSDDNTIPDFSEPWPNRIHLSSSVDAILSLRIPGRLHRVNRSADGQSRSFRLPLSSVDHGEDYHYGRTEAPVAVFTTTKYVEKAFQTDPRISRFSLTMKKEGIKASPKIEVLQ